MAVNGSFSYLADDALGSVEVALRGGSVVASTLYAPYGAVRYHSGTMPTDFGFTGQRSDAASGLDYYGARYYDPVAGQFVSADTELPGSGMDLLGLSREAYVEGDPENRTDPTGHCYFDAAGFCYFPRNGGLVASFDPGKAPPPPGPQRPAATPTPTPTTRNKSNSNNQPSPWDRFMQWLTAPPPMVCVPDGPCYMQGTPEANKCLQEGACTVALRGGVGGRVSVDKGQAGVDQAARDLEARGYTVEGREVTFETTGGRVKVDIIARDPDGNIVAVEVKTGVTAKMNPNQVSGYRALGSTGGIPRGANAAEANLPVDQPIGPIEVVEVAVLP
jgi:RHS repeat-associated protein